MNLSPRTTNAARQRSSLFNQAYAHADTGSGSMNPTSPSMTKTPLPRPSTAMGLQSEAAGARRGSRLSVGAVAGEEGGTTRERPRSAVAGLGGGYVVREKDEGERGEKDEVGAEDMSVDEA